MKGLLSAEGAGRWLLESGRERMEASPAGLPQRKQASQGGIPSHQGCLHPQVLSGSLHAGKRFPLVTTNCCTRQTDPAPRTAVTWLGEAPPSPSGSLRAPSIWVRAGSLTSSSALALSGQRRASPAQSSPLPHAWPGFSSPCYLADLAHALPS